MTGRKDHARSMFAGIAGDYDRWAQLLSFGQDARWHRVMIEPLELAAGDVVADVATGTAAVAIDLVRRHGCRVIGIDQSPEMLAGGARRVEAAGLGERIELVEGQAERLPLEAGSVDALTHTYLLRYVDDPPATVARLAEAIRPGGMMASLEFAVPGGAALPAWRLWTRAGLPLFGAPGGRAWIATGRFLGPSIERFWREHPLEEVLGWWAAAGMEGIRARRLSLGGGIIVWGTRSG